MKSRILTVLLFAFCNLSFAYAQTEITLAKNVPLDLSSLTGSSSQLLVTYPLQEDMCELQISNGGALQLISQVLEIKNFAGETFGENSINQNGDIIVPLKPNAHADGLYIKAKNGKSIAQTLRDLPLSHTGLLTVTATSGRCSKPVLQCTQSQSAGNLRYQTDALVTELPDKSLRLNVSASTYIPQSITTKENYGNYEIHQAGPNYKGEQVSLLSLYKGYFLKGLTKLNQNYPTNFSEGDCVSFPAF